MFYFVVEFTMAHIPTGNSISQLKSSVERVTADLQQLLDVLAAMPATGSDSSSEAIMIVEAAGRLMDAARVRVAAPLACTPGLPEQLGFTSAVAAIAALCGIRETSARARVRVAGGVSDDHTITGAPVPAPHPQVGAALDAGEMGLDAASVIVSELSTVRGRVDREILDAAETVMVERATGSTDGMRFASVVSVDFLATELQQITSVIDPDGARPREVRALRRRAFRIGQQNSNGNIPVSGELLPEVGLLLAGMIEAHRRSPRFALVGDDENSGALPGPDRDDRTPDQRRHDIFAEIITMAAAAQDAPQLDGTPVTVLVTVTAEDLDEGTDALSGPGDPIGVMADSRLPVSRRTVERLIDAHGYRTVTQTPSGRVTSISSKQRCFTAAQRLAIAARDGARCATPGCTNPHYMLQAHHVDPFRYGGPTHIDNGILLCFWHHQQVDSGPWEYRTISGIPHVRGPGILDWTAHRPPTRATHA